MKKTYIKNDDPCIEWLENNFNSFDQFYFKAKEGIINCYKKSDDSLYYSFDRKMIEGIIETHR